MEWIKKMLELANNIMDRLFMALRGKDGPRGGKKLFENAVILLIIGVIAIIAGTYFTGNSDKSTKARLAEAENESRSSKNTTEGGVVSEDDVEKRLAAILSKIKGAGNVSVMITYASTKESIPAMNNKRNERSDSDLEDGKQSRKQSEVDTESTVTYEEEGSTRKPIIVKEIMPQVKGVVVVADGAGSAEVRERLSKAVQAVMDVPMHRIQVFENGKGGIQK